GVVEKCNFCEERIAKNLLPACVEACREGGLIFGDVNKEDSEVRKILSTRLSIRRKPHLGTEPKVYYIL
ncbi:MAG: 4Fe-4S ferredoxin, partial [Syntrophorhabdaceae bacterium]|nr:4Fe-4S ferredoxin [Syntrophorhabdaceae bacterium]